TIDIDLPPDVTITAYHRVGDGHGFEVAWPLPERCHCDRCGREDQAYLEFRDRVQVVRDLDLCGQPSFWAYQPAFHRCPWCNHRQYVIPPSSARTPATPTASSSWSCACSSAATRRRSPGGWASRPRPSAGSSATSWPTPRPRRSIRSGSSPTWA